MLMRLMSKGEYVIVLKGTKFTGSGKLGLSFEVQQALPCTKKFEVPQEWITPFEIHTPAVEDFGKVCHKESVNFQMHLPSAWVLDHVYYRGSKYFI